MTNSKKSAFIYWMRTIHKQIGFIIGFSIAMAVWFTFINGDNFSIRTTLGKLPMIILLMSSMLIISNKLTGDMGLIMQSLAFGATRKNTVLAYQKMTFLSVVEMVVFFGVSYFTAQKMGFDMMFNIDTILLIAFGVFCFANGLGMGGSAIGNKFGVPIWVLTFIAVILLGGVGVIASILIVENPNMTVSLALEKRLAVIAAAVGVITYILGLIVVKKVSKDMEVRI